VERFSSSFQGEYDPTRVISADIGEEDVAARIIQWRSFVPLLVQSPVFGVGFGEYNEFYYGNGYDVFPRAAHSSVIKIGIEEGLIGLFLYAWTLGGAAFASSRILKQAQRPLERVLALGLLACSVCLFFLDLTGTRFLNGNITAFYWILAGMTLNITNSEATDVGRTRRNRHRFQSSPAVRPTLIKRADHNA
jgi:O-antigen ligase